MSKIDPSVFIAAGAHVVGNVEISKDCSVWYNAVIRADNSSLFIDEGTNIQDNCVLHVDFGRKCRIGKNVTIGHNAIVHGCNVGDNTLIGMGAIVMNDANIGKNCIIGAGAVVTQNTEIPNGSLVLGMPAKVRGGLDEERITANKNNAAHYVEMSRKYKDMYSKGR